MSYNSHLLSKDDLLFKSLNKYGQLIKYSVNFKEFIYNISISKIKNTLDNSINRGTFDIILLRRQFSLCKTKFITIYEIQKK
jgi:hypothetical protein